MPKSSDGEGEDSAKGSPGYHDKHMMRVLQLFSLFFTPHRHS